MAFVLDSIATLAAALVLGLASAAWVIFRPPIRPGVRNGAWITDLRVGSTDAGIYLRAHIALTGLFALNKKETVYYRAATDDAGEPLRSDRDYLIEGADLPARWWAIILYGQDHFLIPNARGRYSFNMGNLAREPDGSFRIHLSARPKGKNWLPAGDKVQLLSFSLKVYNPEPIVYEQPGTIGLPRIRRVSGP